MAVRWVRCLAPFQTLSKHDQVIIIQSFSKNAACSFAVSKTRFLRQFSFVIPTAIVASRVVERTVPIALGPMVHTLGLITAAELGKGSRKIARGRHES